MNGEGLVTLLKRVWWMFLLRGIAAILFGLVAIFMPGLAVATLVMMFGLYALADGASTTFGAIKVRKVDRQWWLFALDGVLGLLIGAVALTSPGAVTLGFLVLFATWMIFSGVVRIIAAIRLRKEIEGEWMMIGGGAVSVLFGAFLLSRPLTGILTMTWTIGLFALIVGLVMILLAMKARGFVEKAVAAQA